MTAKEGQELQLHLLQETKAAMEAIAVGLQALPPAEAILAMILLADVPWGSKPYSPLDKTVERAVAVAKSVLYYVSRSAPFDPITPEITGGGNGQNVPG